MVNSDRTVNQVIVIDVEKRRIPSKHYVYVIQVTWSDGTKYMIFRRYSKFFKLQTDLIERFPIEGGVKDPSCRVLPFLPGKIIFGRSHIREVALKRKDAINEYCQGIIQLPPFISQSEEVIDFFSPTSDDIEHLARGRIEKKGSIRTADSISDPVVLEQYVVVANYTKMNKHQVSVVEGDIVDVIETHENGWWLVSFEDEQGWVPSSYLEPVHGIEEDTFQGDDKMAFICVKRFVATEDDELSLESGTVVEVLKRDKDGWWLLKVKENKGWAPRANLKKVPKNMLSGPGDSTANKGAPGLPEKIGKKGRNMEPPPRKKTVKHQRKKITQAKEDINDEPSRNLDVEYVAVAELQAQLGKENIIVKKGTSMEVLEKAPNGWWFVRLGTKEVWVPGTNIQRRKRDCDNEDIYENVANLSLENIDDFETDSHVYSTIDEIDSNDSQYITLGAYVAVDDNGISFEDGEYAEALDKDPSGWWYVRIEDREGWAPSTFLGKVEMNHIIKSAPLTKRPSDKILIGIPPEKPAREKKVRIGYENITLDDTPKSNVTESDKSNVSGVIAGKTDWAGSSGPEKNKPRRRPAAPKRPPVTRRKISNPSVPEKLTRPTEDRVLDVTPNLKSPGRKISAPSGLETNQRRDGHEQTPPHCIVAEKLTRDTEDRVSDATPNLKSPRRKISAPSGLETNQRRNGHEQIPPHCIVSKSIHERQSDSEKIVSENISSEGRSELSEILKARNKAFVDKEGTNDSALFIQESSARPVISPKPHPKPRPRPKSHHPGDLVDSPFHNVALEIEQRLRSSSCATGEERAASTKRNVPGKKDTGYLNRDEKKQPPSRPSQPVQSKVRPHRPPPPKNNAAKNQDQIYVAVCDYTDLDEEMLNFKEGDRITITEKTDSGWWLGKLGSSEGWVPSNFLTKV